MGNVLSWMWDDIQFSKRWWNASSGSGEGSTPKSVFLPKPCLMLDLVQMDGFDF